LPLIFPLDDNGDVLGKLQRGGDDLSLPRDIDFSVVFATEVNATAFAKLFDSPDNRVQVKRADVAPGLPWDVTVTRHMVPDHGAIGDFEEALVRRASPLGGRNDGWGCFAQMNLGSIIASLVSVDDSLTIVAKRPWNADSEARLISTADGGRIPSAVLRDGFEYVLEVSVALDEVLGERADRLSPAQRVAAIIYYAENDAYPDWLNALGAS
jgi:hypothetical protein